MSSLRAITRSALTSPLPRSIDRYLWATSFLTPVGHKANVLVFGPGGYKFFDYARVGALLTLSLFIVTMLILPLLYPLFP